MLEVLGCASLGLGSGEAVSCMPFVRGACFDVDGGGGAGRSGIIVDTELPFTSGFRNISDHAPGDVASSTPSPVFSLETALLILVALKTSPFVWSVVDDDISEVCVKCEELSSNVSLELWSVGDGDGDACPLTLPKGKPN